MLGACILKCWWSMKGLFYLIPEVPVGLCWNSLEVAVLVASVTSLIIASLILHPLSLISAPSTDSKVEAALLTILHGSLCLFPQGEASVLIFSGFCKVWVDSGSLSWLPICCASLQGPNPHWGYWVSWQGTAACDSIPKQGWGIEHSGSSPTCVMILSSPGRRRLLLFSPEFQLVTTICREQSPRSIRICSRVPDDGILLDPQAGLKQSKWVVCEFGLMRIPAVSPRNGNAVTHSALLFLPI